MTRSISLLACCALAAGACVKRLPPPPVPSVAVPVISEAPTPPPANHGRVFIDALDGPARVELIAGTTTTPGAYGYSGDGVVVMMPQTATTTRLLCTTPCWAELPVGQHELRLSIPGTDKVNVIAVDVQPQPRAVRVDLGEQRGVSPATTIGGLLAVTGSVFAVAGAVGLAQDEDKTVAAAFTAGGALVTLMGLAMYGSHRAVLQGASKREWQLAPTANGVSALVQW